MSRDVNTIAIVLDGEEKTLTPTFGAARMISSRYGGVGPTIDRVLKLEIEIVADVVALGLGYFPPNKPPDDFIEKVWRTGLTDDTGALAHHCIIFLQMLAGGGRHPRSSGNVVRGDDENADPQ